jgi:hypothetical protein
LLRPWEILDLGESAVEAIREPDRGLVVGPQTPPPGTKLSASSIKEASRCRLASASAFILLAACGRLHHGNERSTGLAPDVAGV